MYSRMYVYYKMFKVVSNLSPYHDSLDSSTQSEEK